MTGALGARGSTEGFTLDWCHEQAVVSSYRRQVGTTLFDADANVAYGTLQTLMRTLSMSALAVDADIPDSHRTAGR
jgi:hypothetical protein